MNFLWCLIPALALGVIIWWVRPRVSAKRLTWIISCLSFVVVIYLIGRATLSSSSPTISDLEGKASALPKVMGLTLILISIVGGILISYRDKTKYPPSSSRSKSKQGKMLIGVGITIAAIWILISSSKAVVNWWNKPPPPAQTASVVGGGVNYESKVTSRVVSKRITAPLEMVSVPPNLWFRIRPQKNCVWVDSASGKSYKDCPGEHHPLGETVSLRDAMFSFRPEEKGGDVDVIVEWELE